MPNYGLVTDIKKYGAGSLRTPFDTTQNKALRIDPQGSTTFWMSAGEDFYLSAWIRYGTVNVTTVGAKYPIIRYGGASTDFGAPYGWEIGIRTINVGGSNTAVPYFAYNNQIINTTFDGTNGNTISPSSSAFDHYEVYRSNNTITFKFTNSSNTANTTTASYSLNIGQLAADYYTNAIFVGSEQPFVVNQDNGAYIDELFFAKGTSQVTSRYPDNSIADGGLSTTIFLLNFDNSLRDDSGPITAAANLTATTTLSATGQQFEGTLINLSAASTINCSATKVPGNIFSANLASSFAQSTQVNRTARTTISLSAFNSEVVVGTKAIGAIASLTSSFALSAQGSLAGARPLTLTTVGSTSFVTTPKVLGTHSVRLLNSSSYLITESATNRLNMSANQDFVIEFFYNPQYALANNNPRLIAGFYSQADGSPIWSIETNTNRYLQFKYLTTSGLQTLTANQTANPLQSTGTWYWISISRTANQLKIKQRGFSVSFGNNQAGENNNSSTVTVTSRIGNSSTLGNLRFGGPDSASNYGYGYYDEFFMAKGTGEYTTTNDANGWSNLSSFEAITLGAEDTTQALYHWDNALTDSTTGIKTAAVAMSSAFSQQTNAGKLVSGATAISSSNNLTVLARKIAEVNAVLATTTQVFAGVTRTKSGTATISSNFVQAATVVATRGINSALQAQISFGVTANRIRTVSIALSAFNTELAVGSRIVRATAALTATSQLSATAIKIKPFSAALASTSQVTASATITRSTVVALVTTSTVAVTAITVRSAAVALQSATSQTAVGQRTRTTTITLQAFNTELALGSKSVRAQAALTVSSQLTCTAVRNVTQQFSAAVTARAGIAIVAGVQRGTAQANLTTNVYWSYIYDKTLPLTLEGDLWVIPADERIYVIPASIADWAIELDLRTYIVE
jgi:hypothetical protein